MGNAITRRVVLVMAAALPSAMLAGRARAAAESFKVPLAGSQQVPPVQTSGSGSADLTWNPATRVVTWSITYSGLSSSVTMAHFHGPATAGKNAPVLVWLTKRGAPVSSPITGKATLSATQTKQFAAGEWYINVHTKDHPAGEIRGQVQPPTA